MPAETPLTYRDVATILALIDGPQGGSIKLAQYGMEIRVEKIRGAAISPLLHSDVPGTETS